MLNLEFIPIFGLENIPFFKKGSKIYIKKENRGKFTKSAKAAGESVQEHAAKVLSDPNATPLQRKRANFARNAAKWKYQEGGILKISPKEQKYLEWSKMTPKQKREYRINRAKSYLQSGPTITNFFEAFQSYIGNRDPKNPDLITGTAPTPGWGKQGITGLHKIMVKLPEAKQTLIAPLAGRSRAAATLKMEDIVKAQQHRDEVYKRWASLYKQQYNSTLTTFRTKPAKVRRQETDISKSNGRTLKGGQASGNYNNKTHTINVTTSKTTSVKNLENTGFHEGIHSYGLGESPSYQWKTKYLNFPKGTNSYYLDSREIATQSLEQGQNLGIKVGQSYPGKERLIKIIENRPDGQTFGGVPYILYKNAKTNQDYRRLWNLLNGTF